MIGVQLYRLCKENVTEGSAFAEFIGQWKRLNKCKNKSIT